MPKRSVFWQYFKHSTQRGFAVCQLKLCRGTAAANIKLSSGSTKGMSVHLQSKHKKEFEACRNVQTQEATEAGREEQQQQSIYILFTGKADSSKQSFSECGAENEIEVRGGEPVADDDDADNDSSSISRPVSRQSGFGPMDYYCGSAKNCPEADCLVVNWLSTATLPYKTVDNEHFRKFIGFVNSLQFKYEMPREGKLRKVIIPEIYAAVKWKISQVLSKEVSSFCFDTDFWSSITQQSYLSFVLHFIDYNWERKMIVLRCKPAFYRHTAENVAEDLRSIIEEWGLKDKLDLVLRDSAANMVASMRVGQMDDTNCFEHLLHLIVIKGVLAQRAVADMLNRASNVVKDFTNKQEYRDALRKAFAALNKPPLVLIRNQVTRWTSTMKQLSRLLQTKQPIALAMSMLEEADITVPSHHKLTPNDWRLIESLDSLLSHFEKTTLMAEKETSCISEVIFHAHTLRKKLENAETRFVQITQTSLLKYIDKYLYGGDERVQYVNIEKSEPHSIATILDLRFKVAKIFRDNTAHEDAVLKLKELVVEECRQAANAQPSIVVVEQTNEPSTSISGFKASGNYWAESMELLSSSDSPSQHSDETVAVNILPEEVGKKELEAYMADNTQLPTENPLHYWEMKKKIFPNLARVAQRFLAAPLSSVSSEREFKVGKRVITDTRTRLLPQNAEMLIWLNYNIRAVGCSTFSVLKEYDKAKDAEPEHQLIQRPGPKFDDHITLRPSSESD